MTAPYVTPNTIIETWCCWCDPPRFLGTKPGLGQSGRSDTICEECAQRVMEEHEEEAA